MDSNFTRMGMKTRLTVLVGLVLCLGKCFIVFRVGVLPFVVDNFILFFIYFLTTWFNSFGVVCSIQ